MIVSMTGFGRATCQISQKTLVIEMKSVNSKQLDLSFRLNPLIREQETEFRNLLSEKAQRGKIDVVVYFENTNQATTKTINTKTVKAYYKELMLLEKELKSKSNNLLEIALTLPGIFDEATDGLPDKDKKTVTKTFMQALQMFIKHREHEGKQLEKDLLFRIKNIETLLNKTEKEDKNRLPEIKKRIQKKLEESIEKSKIDNNRFEQELIYFLERNDITEEKIRLKTHCDYFLQTTKEKFSGRKLAFICQEIGREINTIGSKANHAPIQKLVVEMKDELEKIKEQLNNVL